MVRTKREVQVPVKQEPQKEPSSHLTLTRGMWLFAFILAAFAVAQNSTIQSSTSVAFDAGVPTNAPVAGDYNGAWRPQIHFSPPKDFINDPNGCFVDANGTWHLYYQCKL